MATTTSTTTFQNTMKPHNASVKACIHENYSSVHTLYQNSIYSDAFTHLPILNLDSCTYYAGINTYNIVFFWLDKTNLFKSAAL